MKFRPFLSCKQAHQLVSEGMDRQLNLTERTRLRMHLQMCDACTNFNGQMQLLRKAVRSFPVADLFDVSKDRKDHNEN